MRIVDVQTLLVRAPMPRDYWGREAWKGDYGDRSGEPVVDLSATHPVRWRMRHRWAGTVDTILLRVLTDDGVVGYGESKGVISPEAVKAHIDGTLREAVLGLDPVQTRVVWDRMMALMRGRGHVQGFHQEASAGIDLACWDIVGKVAGRPLCDMLGGRYRSSLPVYFSGFAGLNDADDPAQREALAAAARGAAQAGFRAGKIAIGFGRRADLASVEVVREATDEHFTILVDALGAYTYSDALWLGHAFAERGVVWFETPLTPEDIDGHVELSRQLPILIANDLLWTTALVKEQIKRGGRMVVQPEVIKAGVTECRRIAELADIYNVPFAPHSSLGSAVQYAATCHVGVSAPNLVISEHWANPNPLGNPIVTHPIEPVDGRIEIPEAPGLGIEFEMDALSPYIVDGAWEAV